MRILLSRRLLATIVALCFIYVAQAGWTPSRPKIDGIWYYFNTSKCTAEVAWPNSEYKSDYYKGDIVVPSTVTYNDVEYTVTAFFNSPFRGQTELTSITIPSTVTSIGDFGGCSKLTKIVIPNSVTEFDNFNDCTALKEITLPEGLTNLDASFRNCTSLETITIPKSVETISRQRMFEGCTSLKSIIIKGKCTIGGWTFWDCNADYVKFEEPAIFDKEAFKESNINVVYCQPEDKEEVSAIRMGNVCAINCPYYIDVNSIVSKPRSVSFKLARSLYSDDLTSLTKVTVMGETCLQRADGSYIYKGLKPQEGTPVHLTVNQNGKTEMFWTQNIYASDHEWETKPYGNTNTTIQQMVKVTGDDNYEVEECGLYYNKNFYPAIMRNTWDGMRPVALVDNLEPGKRYSFNCYVKYTDGVTFLGKEVQETPNIPNIFIKQISVGPTSIKLKGVVYLDDAHIIRRGFVVDGYGSDKDSIYLIRNDFEPGKTYAISYDVDLKESLKTFSSSTKITTPSVTLETLQAKPTSETSVILSAKTNLETTVANAGFEWRRYDAPEELPSTKVACAGIDNQLMGTLRKLKSELYYKYRPYYTTTSGKSYYGDWVAFIPGDASTYFEPVTRTYAVAEITESTAQVCGAVVAGTDDIIEQGFEYWKTTEVQTRAASGDVKKVKANGQMMTATLTDLEPGTAYSYRVYAKTSNGVTYGDEQNFTTGGTPTGIVQTTSAANEEIAIKGQLNARIFVKANTGTSPIVWEIIGMNGQTIDCGRTTSRGNWTEINHKPLSPSIYLLRITANQETKTYKQAVR